MEAFFRAVGTSVESRDAVDPNGPTEAERERMNAVSPEYDIERLGPLPPAE